MISPKLSKMLVEQIGHELSAHQHYLAIALYFERKSLDGWGKLFREQAVEEGQHADKIIRFLTDCEVEFDLPALTTASTKFASAAKAVEAALKSEQKVSAQFQAMAAAAAKEGDYTALQFMQWFIEEQVEEESKMQKLLDLVESGLNLFQAEPLLESFK